MKSPHKRGRNRNTKRAAGNQPQADADSAYFDTEKPWGDRNSRSPAHATSPAGEWSRALSPRKEAKSSPEAAPMNANTSHLLEDVFAAYAGGGAGEGAESLLMNFQAWNTFCSECKLAEGNTSRDMLNRLFYRTASGRGSSALLSFDGFARAMSTVAESKYGATDSVARLVYFKIIRFGRTAAATAVASQAAPPTRASAAAQPLRRPQQRLGSHATSHKSPGLAHDEGSDGGGGGGGGEHSSSSDSSPSPGPRTHKRTRQSSGGHGASGGRGVGGRLELEEQEAVSSVEKGREEDVARRVESRSRRSLAAGENLSVTQYREVRRVGTTNFYSMESGY